MFVKFVSPKEYKSLSKDLEIIGGFGFTPFGKSLLAFNKMGICFLAFGEDEEKLFYELKKSYFDTSILRDDTQVQEYFKNIFLYNKEINIFAKGTDFQVSVWQELLKIPDASTTTYQDIANSINKPKAVRAVARAIGANDISYLIPCHRVIGKSGSLQGYRWGIEIKKKVLTYEAKK